MNFWSIFTQNLAIPLRRAIPKFPLPCGGGLSGWVDSANAESNAKNGENLAESAPFFRHCEKIRRIFVAIQDSANLCVFPSLRDFAKQNRGNPQIFAIAKMIKINRAKHP
ncbi:hypothetical protein ACWIUD_07120 [Helicobacter sp. 23-1044]